MAGKRKGEPSTTEIDMTPMIDMTFQLITFFMFVMNFSEAEQDDRIQLPMSQLAKPVEGPTDTPITLQLTNSGSVIYAGELVALSDIGSYLDREKNGHSGCRQRTECGNGNHSSGWSIENG